VTDARVCHPWLYIDRIVRAVLAERMTYGATDELDRVLMLVARKRDEIERAGWFN
jgi:hypothetical protein